MTRVCRTTGSGTGEVMTETVSLRALALVCSLKPSPAPSSSELMARQVLDALGEHGVTGDVVRVVDHDVKPGVEIDMGEGTHGPRSASSSWPPTSSSSPPRPGAGT